MAEHEEESLAVEIKTFNDLKAPLEQNHMGKFVVVKDDKLILHGTRWIPPRARL